MSYALKPPITGCILRILQNTSDSNIAWVVLDIFDVAATRYNVFEMSILKQRLKEKKVIAVRTKVVFDPIFLSD